jgi:hypothetical protein
LFRFIVLTGAKIRIISQSYSLLPLKVTKRHEKRAGSRADIFGLGFLLFVSPHYYILQAVPRGGLLLFLYPFV